MALQPSRNLTDLSPELLCHILQYMPLKEVLSISMLCKKLLCAVELHLRLCKGIDFCEDKIYGFMPSGITDDHILSLLKRCPHVETVFGLHPLKVERRRQRKRCTLTVPGIIEALSMCCNLKSVETSDLRLLEALMLQLPQIRIIGHFQNRDGEFPPKASHRLKLIPYPRISSLHLNCVEVPELTPMPHLEHMHLQCVRFTKLQPFRAFLATKLKTFVMKHCMGPSLSLRYLSLIIALSSAPLLTRLELVRVLLPGGLFQRAVEDSYRHNGFVNLKVIVISGCKGILEADLGHIMIAASKNLERICIQPSLTRDSLFVSLSFAQCEFPKLNSIHLGFVDRLNSPGEYSNDVLLTLGLAEVPDTPSSLTDSGMKVISQLFPNIKTMSVSNCPHLMAMDQWSPVDGEPAWKELTDLTLERCHCLQLPSFALFLAFLPKIEVVILNDMFREPPKGCSHVGLSAGTGLGMSSAVVSNQDEHIAVQGHQQDFELQADEHLENEELDRDFIDGDDDNPDQHIMVLQQQFFDDENPVARRNPGNRIGNMRENVPENRIRRELNEDYNGDPNDGLDPFAESDSSDEDYVPIRVSKKPCRHHGKTHDRCPIEEIEIPRPTSRVLRSSNLSPSKSSTGSQCPSTDFAKNKATSSRKKRVISPDKKCYHSKGCSSKCSRGFDPNQPSTSRGGNCNDFACPDPNAKFDKEKKLSTETNQRHKRHKEHGEDTSTNSKKRKLNKLKGTPNKKRSVSIMSKDDPVHMQEETTETDKAEIQVIQGLAHKIKVEPTEADDGDVIHVPVNKVGTDVHIKEEPTEADDEDNILIPVNKASINVHIKAEPIDEDVIHVPVNKVGTKVPIEVELTETDDEDVPYVSANKADVDGHIKVELTETDEDVTHVSANKADGDVHIKVELTETDDEDVTHVSANKADVDVHIKVEPTEAKVVVQLPLDKSGGDVAIKAEPYFENMPIGVKTQNIVPNKAKADKDKNKNSKKRKLDEHQDDYRGPMTRNRKRILKGRKSLPSGTKRVGVNCPSHVCVMCKKEFADTSNQNSGDASNPIAVASQSREKPTPSGTGGNSPPHQTSGDKTKDPPPKCSRLECACHRDFMPFRMKRGKKTPPRRTYNTISQGTQATSADIRRSLRKQRSCSFRCKYKKSGSCGSNHFHSRNHISARQQFKRPKQNKSNLDLRNKSTSTSDPLMEDDAVQTLRLVSETLISLTIISCGISDIVIDHCQSLSHVEVQACRILKMFQLHYCPSLKRLNISQCPKLSLEVVVPEVLSLVATKKLLVTFEPCMQVYYPTDSEKAIFSRAPLDQSIILFQDITTSANECTQAVVKENLLRWMEIVQKLYYTPSFWLSKQKKKKNKSKESNTYPYGHSLRRVHGVFTLPSTDPNGFLWKYQILTNDHVFASALENMSWDKGFPAPETCEHYTDDGALISMIETEFTEKSLKMRKKITTFYIPAIESFLIPG